MASVKKWRAIQEEDTASLAFLLCAIRRKPCHHSVFAKIILTIIKFFDFRLIHPNSKTHAVEKTIPGIRNNTFWITHRQKPLVPALFCTTCRVCRSWKRDYWLWFVCFTTWGISQIPGMMKDRTSKSIISLCQFLVFGMILYVQSRHSFRLTVNISEIEVDKILSSEWPRGSTSPAIAYEGGREVCIFILDQSCETT